MPRSPASSSQTCEVARAAIDFAKSASLSVRPTSIARLRTGELLALRWSSFDLEVGALTVRESVIEGKFQAPKTQRAVQTIPLGPYAVKALNEHQERIARSGDGDLVFGNRKGDPMRESKLLADVLQPAAAVAFATVNC